MTIVLRHNEALDLNLVEYSDRVSLADLKALARYVAIRPEHMRRDAFNVVLAGTSFVDVDGPALDSLFALYRDLYSTLDFQMLRRAAWVCHSPAAAEQVAHWLGGDIREGMSSAVRQFDTVAEACEWLVLNASDVPIIERREGFVEVTRFGAAADLTR